MNTFSTALTKNRSQLENMTYTLYFVKYNYKYVNTAENMPTVEVI